LRRTGRRARRREVERRYQQSYAGRFRLRAESIDAERCARGVELLERIVAMLTKLIDP
jgi:hypothetical protein